MKINTQQFGEIEVREEELLVFPEGMLGFSHAKKFALLESQEVHPFVWLQSIDDPAIAFVIVDPLVILPDYQIQVHPEDIESLDIKTPEDAKVLAVCVVPSDPSNATMNLKGPLIINSRNRLGKQVVLPDPNYSTKEPIWPQVTNQEEVK